MTPVAAAAAVPWTDRGAFWIALVAALLSAGSLAVSIWIGGRSAQAAEESAAAAKVSAETSRSSAEASAAVARAELDRDHQIMYRPPAVGEFFRKHNARTGDDNLFFRFIPPRTYRISGVTVTGNSSSPLALSPIVPGGKMVEVYVDDVTATKPLSTVDSLHFEFWPPVNGDPGEPWTCRCGQSTDPSGPRHWEWNVPVLTPPRTPPEAVYSA